jgi:hypothetical protein
MWTKGHQSFASNTLHLLVVLLSVSNASLAAKDSRPILRRSFGIVATDWLDTYASTPSLWPGVAVLN